MSAAVESLGLFLGTPSNEWKGTVWIRFSPFFALNKWHGVSWPKPWPKSQLLVEDAKARLRWRNTLLHIIYPCLSMCCLRSEKSNRDKNPKFWEQFCWVCSFWEHPKSALKGKNTSKKYFVFFFSLKLLNVPLGSHFNDNNNSDNFPRTAGFKSLPQSKHCVSHSCRKLDFIIPFSSFLLGWICLPTFAQNGYLRNSQRNMV